MSLTLPDALIALGLMKQPLLLAAVVVAALLPSCQSVSIIDQPVLSRTAMRFDERGARATDGALVNQVEKGRSFSNSTSGGACASCH